MSDSYSTRAIERPRHLLFLSHAGVDTEAARQLVELIERTPEAKQRRLKVWMDKRDLEPGKDWQQELEKVIEEQSTAFAVYVGNSGVVNWVDSEVRLALARARRDCTYRVIPVLSAASEATIALPGFARQYHGVRDVENDAAELAKLIRAATGESADQPVHLVANPFPGLRAFGEEDTQLFFGREKETEELISRLRRDLMVMVVGDSGSGKSSLVRAGLVARFRGGAFAERTGEVPDDTVWHVVQTRPRGRPFRCLADDITVAARVAGIDTETRGTIADWVRTEYPEKIRDALREGSPTNSRVLLVVDQFEELLTLADEEDRQPYINALMALTDDPSDTFVRVVLTMRRDYYNLCSQFKLFYQRLESEDARATYAVRRMSDEDVRMCVREPLKLAGVEETKLLEDEVIKDIGDQPSELALLQMALSEAWRKRTEFDGDLLKAYVGVGRVMGALAKSADEVFEEEMDDRTRELAELVFLRLVRLGDTGGTSKRIAAREEFDAESWALVQKLSTEPFRRLLFISGEKDRKTAELSHDALVTQWPRYQAWLHQAAPDKRIHDRVIRSAQVWAVGGCQKADLATGNELEEGLRLLENRRIWLAHVELAFLTAGRTALRKGILIKRIATIVLVILTITSAFFGWYARRQRDDAIRLRNEALARQLAAQAELMRSRSQDSLEESVLLTLESIKLGYTVETEQVLRKGLALLPRPVLEVLQDLTPPYDTASGVSFSGDDRYFAVAKGRLDNSAVVLSVDSGQEVFRVRGEGPINIVALHPSARYLATGGSDGRGILWGFPSGKELFSVTNNFIETVSHSLRTGKEIRRQEIAQITDLSFSTDGKYLAITSEGGSLRMLDISSLQLSFAVNLESFVSGVSFSPKGDLVAARTGRFVVIWETATGNEKFRVEPHINGADQLAFDPLGRLLATTQFDSATMWDVQTQEKVAEFPYHLQVHGRSQLSFSPDGKYIWTADADNTIRKWNVTSKREVLRIQQDVDFLTISPDGRYVGTADLGNVARIWRATDGSEIARFSHEGQMKYIRFGNQSKHMATAATDGIVRLWNLRMAEPVAELRHSDSDRGPEWISFGASEDIVVTASEDETNVWEIMSGKLIKRIESRGRSFGVAVGHGGNHIVCTAGDKVFLREVETGEVETEFKLPGLDLGRSYSWNPDIGPRGSLFSPDARYLAKAINDQIRLWELTTSGPVLRMEFSPNSYRIAFNLDSTHLVVVSGGDSTSTSKVSVLELRNGQEVIEVTSWDFADQIPLLAVGKDRVAISIGEASRGWNIEEGPRTYVNPGAAVALCRLEDGQIVTVLTFPFPAMSLAFNPDGKALAAGLRDGTARVFRVPDGKELARIDHRGQVTFSPTGIYLATVGQGSARLSLWRHADLVEEASLRLTRNFTLGEWKRHFSGKPYERTCTNLPPHYKSFLKEGERRALLGDIDGTVEILKEAIGLGLSLGDEPEMWAKRIAARERVEQGVRLARRGAIKKAVESFSQAQALDDSVEIRLAEWNILGWEGVIRDMASDVMYCCEKAVELDPNNGAVRDSRGVGRALLGDYEGAIEDFQFYIKWGQNKRPAEFLSKRQEWIEELQAGRNPFDEATLKALRKE